MNEKSLCPDIISENGIRKYISDKVPFGFHIYDSVDSTNIRMKELAENNDSEWTVIISGSQTMGKGRLGRTFFSPSDTGIYMTILLRPSFSIEDTIKVTTAMATAVSEAIENISGEKTDIKWVNDIYIYDKKVSGILTESSFDAKTNLLKYAFVGVGINVYAPDNDFPDDIKNIAGYVFSERKEDIRNRIIAEILDRFSEYYNSIEQNTYFDNYKKRLLWIGEKINIISSSGIIPATLKGIDNNCRLIVSYEDNTEGIVSSGEISIRKKENSDE